MWIRLLQPQAVFYPSRVEPAGSVHSIGTPRGAQLVAAGIAEETAKPPEPDNNRVTFRPGSAVAKIDRPITTPPWSSQANALAAALSRRARRKTARKF
jgi:hypothetical protein